MNIEQIKVKANGLTFNVAVAGEGPLVLLCHGFPELWYSWRSQIVALANSGYRVAAPDMRGYGDTDKPAEIDQYSIFHLTGDTVALVHALGEEKAIIVGHDWGAYASWYSALFRPDVFYKVAALSVPLARRPSHPPVRILESTAAKQGMEFYQVWFQEPGVAEAAFEADVRAMQTGLFYSSSGDASAEEAWQAAWPIGTKPEGLFKKHPKKPSWLTEEELDLYVQKFTKSGYRGPLNWYRNMDRNWEQTAPFEGKKVEVPALFMIGEKDLTLSFAKPALKHLDSIVPKLRKSITVPGAGHWLQQEAPDLVNRELLEFIKENE